MPAGVHPAAAGGGAVCAAVRAAAGAR